MRTLKLVPADTAIGFIRHRTLAFAVSGLLIVASLVSLAVRGLDFGIDFRGGTLIELRAAEPMAESDIAALRARLGTLPLGDFQIQQFGAPQDVLVRVSGAPEAATAAGDLAGVAAMRAALEDEFEFRRVEIVGPQVSRELIRAGLIAVAAAIASMLIYIWFRFEWQFSVGAVLALVHDVVLTLGLFSIFGFDFDLSILAAILTIVGYSMNDTVVVYDRVRETLRRFKSMPLPELLDRAVNETLSRTVMTSVTTLLALVALYALGGEVIRGFTLAMIWGVVVGTYSSVFIAAPLLQILDVKRDWSAA